MNNQYSFSDKDMRVPKPHHLIYGTLKDYLTEEELTDTDDERIRQELSRLMVEEKGYARELLIPRLKIETLFSRCFVTSTIELTVSVQQKQAKKTFPHKSSS